MIKNKKKYNYKNNNTYHSISINKTCTILDMLRWTSNRFNAAKIFYGHGTNNFWDETLHLILPSLHLPIHIPTKMYHVRLTKKEQEKIIQLVNHRIHKNIPVPYLTNQAWFCGLKFYVDERVFIPRSPIGELIPSYFRNILSYTPRKILDMCTGSGSIAIAIALMYPKSEIDAVDISINALKIAKYNIKLYNLENRIIPIYSNLFHKLSKLKYDLIVTNPPYVNKSEISKLPKEFRYEPILSLSAGNDGLKIIRKILKNVTKYLNKNGVLICETGLSKKSLIKFYPQIPFQWLHFINGGDGVFTLTYKQLLNCQKFFN